MNSAEVVFSKFGGQTALATALNIRQSNVSYWAKKGAIPTKWHALIIDAAGRAGIQISASDFINATPLEVEIEAPPVLRDPRLKVLNHGVLDIAGDKVRCAVLSNGKRVVFQREIVSLFTGHKKGGLSRYLGRKNLEPFLPEKFKNRPIEEAVYVFEYKSNLGAGVAHGFEGEDLIEICDMYLKARQAGELHPSQEDLAKRAEIITRVFAKLGIVAAIDEATGYQKQRDEYQKLLANYIAEELQPWIKTFGENFYAQIYRLKGWDWSRYSIEGKNHPWEVAKITNRIIYEKLPNGVLDKLQELNPRTEKGYRKYRNFQFLTPNAGYVHLVKHMGHVEAIMERHEDGNWMKALHEIDTRFPSLRDPYGQPLLSFNFNKPSTVHGS